MKLIKDSTVNSKTVKSLHFILAQSGTSIEMRHNLNCFCHPQSDSISAGNYRVATDLENLEKSGNLKETSESKGISLKSQGILDRIPKVREKSGNFVV